jgi:hypothetical protein
VYLKNETYFNEKEGDMMVNENFEEFNKVQQKHQGEYLGTDRKQPYGLNDPEYNNQSNTDKAIGATGRNSELKS